MCFTAMKTASPIWKGGLFSLARWCAGGWWICADTAGCVWCRRATATTSSGWNWAIRNTRPIRWPPFQAAATGSRCRPPSSSRPGPSCFSWPNRYRSLPASRTGVFGSIIELVPCRPLWRRVCLVGSGKTAAPGTNDATWSSSGRHVEMPRPSRCGMTPHLPNQGVAGLLRPRCRVLSCIQPPVSARARKDSVNRQSVPDMNRCVTGAFALRA